MKPVFDTNILIDFLAGKQPAREELARYPAARIAGISWIEVMVGARGQEDEATVREFLNSFEIVPLDREVAEATVRIRRLYRLKLPDAVIWASAKTRDALLITRNTRDYSASEPDIRIPYVL
jgi:predicted nucleic acid-binding protein